MNRQMVKISNEKLLREIEKRGLVGRQMSAEMGFAPGYLSCCGARGQMSKSGLTMLERMFDIRPEEIMKDDDKPKPEPEQIAIPEIPVDPINYERLAAVIREAVYAAVKKAWSE